MGGARAWPPEPRSLPSSSAPRGPLASPRRAPLYRVPSAALPSGLAPSRAPAVGGRPDLERTLDSVERGSGRLLVEASLGPSRGPSFCSECCHARRPKVIAVPGVRRDLSEGRRPRAGTSQSLLFHPAAAPTLQLSSPVGDPGHPLARPERSWSRPQGLCGGPRVPVCPTRQCGAATFVLL